MVLFEVSLLIGNLAYFFEQGKVVAQRIRCQAFFNQNKFLKLPYDCSLSGPKARSEALTSF